MTTTKKIEIVLVNNGIGTLQIGKVFAHAYDNMQQLADDYFAVMDGDDPLEWDNNEIDYLDTSATKSDLIVDNVYDIDTKFGRNAEELHEAVIRNVKAVVGSLGVECKMTTDEAVAYILSGHGLKGDGLAEAMTKIVNKPVTRQNANTWRQRAYLKVKN